MNKGLSVHLIATFLYILCIMYIFQEQSPDKFERLLIVFFMLIKNYIVSVVCYFNDYYDKKINFKK